MSVTTAPAPLPCAILSSQEYRLLVRVKLRLADEIRAPYATPADLVRLRFWRWLYRQGRVGEDA